MRCIVFVAVALLLAGESRAGTQDALLPWFKADRIVVRKSERKLELWWRGAPVKSYRVSLGRNPQEPKLREGDKRTPEGVYTITGRNPRSEFHRSLSLSYPNAEDIARSRAAGVAPGNGIVIHGLSPTYAPMGESHVFYDWTEGCIAVTNVEIEEIWKAVDDGTEVEIVP